MDAMQQRSPSPPARRHAQDGQLLGVPLTADLRKEDALTTAASSQMHMQMHTPVIQPPGAPLIRSLPPPAHLQPHMFHQLHQQQYQHHHHQHAAMVAASSPQRSNRRSTAPSSYSTGSSSHHGLQPPGAPLVHSLPPPAHLPLHHLAPHLHAHPHTHGKGLFHPSPKQLQRNLAVSGNSSSSGSSSSAALPSQHALHRRHLSGGGAGTASDTSAAMRALARSMLAAHGGSLHHHPHASSAHSASSSPSSSARSLRSQMLAPQPHPPHAAQITPLVLPPGARSPEFRARPSPVRDPTPFMLPSNALDARAARGEPIPTSQPQQPHQPHQHQHHQQRSLFFSLGAAALPTMTARSHVRVPMVRPARSLLHAAATGASRVDEPLDGARESPPHSSGSGSSSSGESSSGSGGSGGEDSPPRPSPLTERRKMSDAHDMGVLRQQTALFQSKRASGGYSPPPHSSSHAASSSSAHVLPEAGLMPRARSEMSMRRGDGGGGGIQPRRSISPLARRRIVRSLSEPPATPGLSPASAATALLASSPQQHQQQKQHVSLQQQHQQHLQTHAPPVKVIAPFAPVLRLAGGSSPASAHSLSNDDSSTPPSDSTVKSSSATLPSGSSWFDSYDGLFYSFRADLGDFLAYVRELLRDAVASMAQGGQNERASINLAERKLLQAPPLSSSEIPPPPAQTPIQAVLPGFTSPPSVIRAFACSRSLRQHARSLLRALEFGAQQLEEYPPVGLRLQQMGADLLRRAAAKDSTSGEDAAALQALRDEAASLSKRFISPVPASQLLAWRSWLGKGADLAVATWSASEWESAERSHEGSALLVSARMLDVSDRIQGVYEAVEKVAQQQQQQQGSKQLSPTAASSAVVTPDDGNNDLIKTTMKQLNTLSSSSLPDAALDASPPSSAPPPHIVHSSSSSPSSLVPSFLHPSPTSSSALHVHGSHHSASAALLDEILFLLADLSALFHVFPLLVKHQERQHAREYPALALWERERGERRAKIEAEIAAAAAAAAEEAKRKLSYPREPLLVPAVAPSDASLLVAPLELPPVAPGAQPLVLSNSTPPLKDSTSIMSPSPSAALVPTPDAATPAWPVSASAAPGTGAAHTRSLSRTEMSRALSHSASSMTSAGSSLASVPSTSSVAALSRSLHVSPSVIEHSPPEIAQIESNGNSSGGSGSGSGSGSEGTTAGPSSSSSSGTPADSAAAKITKRLAAASAPPVVTAATANAAAPPPVVSSIVVPPPSTVASTVGGSASASTPSSSSATPLPHTARAEFLVKLATPPSAGSDSSAPFAEFMQPHRRTVSNPASSSAAVGWDGTRVIARPQSSLSALPPAALSLPVAALPPIVSNDQAAVFLAQTAARMRLLESARAQEKIKHNANLALRGMAPGYAGGGVPATLPPLQVQPTQISPPPPAAKAGDTISPTDALKKTTPNGGTLSTAPDGDGGLIVSHNSRDGGSTTMLRAIDSSTPPMFAVRGTGAGAEGYGDGADTVSPEQAGRPTHLMDERALSNENESARGLGSGEQSSRMLSGPYYGNNGGGGGQSLLGVDSVPPTPLVDRRVPIGGSDTGQPIPPAIGVPGAPDAASAAAAPPKKQRSWLLRFLCCGSGGRDAEDAYHAAGLPGLGSPSDWDSRSLQPSGIDLALGGGGGAPASTNASMNASGTGWATTKSAVPSPNWPEHRSAGESAQSSAVGPGAGKSDADSVPPLPGGGRRDGGCADLAGPSDAFVPDFHVQLPQPYPTAQLPLTTQQPQELKRFPGETAVVPQQERRSQRTYA